MKWYLLIILSLKVNLLSNIALNRLKQYIINQQRKSSKSSLQILDTIFGRGFRKNQNEFMDINHYDQSKVFPIRIYIIDNTGVVRIKYHKTHMIC